MAVNNFTVAIWMVTYNHEKFIETAVESVMMQNSNFSYKLFIGEDFSQDSTREKCLDLYNKYPDRIELILNNKNIGHIQNAKQVYLKCFEYKPKYIAMLEGDDYWTDPLKLQKQVSFLEKNENLSFSFTRYWYVFGMESNKYIDKNEKFFKNENENILYDLSMFTKGWAGGLATFVFRASFFDIKSLDKYNLFRDIHLYLELLKNGNGVCLNFFSTVYRSHKGGIDSTLTKIEKSKVAMRCYNELRHHNPDIVQVVEKFNFFYIQYIKLLIDKNKLFTAFKESCLLLIRTYDYHLFVKTLKLIFNHYYDFIIK